MRNRHFTGIVALVLTAIVVTAALGCASLGGAGSVRTAGHKDWDAIIKELYPDAWQLNVERFRSRWGAVVDGNEVFFDGTNYHDFVYVFPGGVNLSDYEGFILVMEIYDIHKPDGSNSPTKNVSFSFRKGPTEVAAAEDNYNARKLKQFWPADDADFFPFPQNGVFIAGISGDQYTSLINDPVYSGGINIQNSIWGANGSHMNRTAYTMKMLSMFLLPKHDTSGFGVHGSEYVLDPKGFIRSGAWGGNDAIGDIIMMNNNGSVVYNFPAGLNTGSYNTLVIGYRILDNSGGDMTVTVRANTHEGGMLGAYVLEESGTLKVPLEGVYTGFALRNNLRRSANSANYVLKIDSLKLTNE